MVDRSVEVEGAMMVAQAKRMYQRTLSLWVMDYLESRSLLKKQRAVRSILAAQVASVAEE